MTRLKSPSKKAHKLVHFLHLQMQTDGITQRELAARAGLSHSTFVHWWNGKRDPVLSSMEVALNAIGYTMKATPLIDNGPAAKQWLETQRSKRKSQRKDKPFA